MYYIIVSQYENTDTVIEESRISYCPFIDTTANNSYHLLCKKNNNSVYGTIMSPFAAMLRFKMLNNGLILSTVLWESTLNQLQKRVY